MAPDSVEIIRGIYARWGEGDFELPADLFDPLVLFVVRPEFPDAGTYLGVKRLAEYTRSVLQPWSKLTIAAEEIIAAGDSFVARVHQSGVGDSSGIATEFRYFHVWSFRGGKVIRLENCRERSEALEAVGTPEREKDSP